MGRRAPPAAATAIATTFLVVVLFMMITARQHGHAVPKRAELARRMLIGGPGSWPPSCRSKCGSCTPCKAVHVPIQPGVSVPLEYYPEAWRCKCGNKLYMP